MLVRLAAALMLVAVRVLALSPGRPQLQSQIRDVRNIQIDLRCKKRVDVHFDSRARAEG